MYSALGISEKVINLANEAEENIKDIFENIEKIEEYNSIKVLNAFQKNEISEIHFNSTTGYGYGDIGRDTTEKVFADIFKAEDSIVRGQFISGTHALTVTLFALLRPGDTLLSITGKPYDTLDEVIGIVDNPSSLKSYNVNFEQIDLKSDSSFDFEAIEERLKNSNIKVIEIQRSKGYSTRKSITITRPIQANLYGKKRSLLRRLFRRFLTEWLRNFPISLHSNTQRLTTQELMHSSVTTLIPLQERLSQWASRQALMLPFGQPMFRSGIFHSGQRPKSVQFSLR